MEETLITFENCLGEKENACCFLLRETKLHPYQGSHFTMADTDP